MKDRMRYVLALFHGKIDEWDLNNEMLHGDYFGRKLGLANGAAYFKWAKEIDPGVRFCVNDYGIMQGKRGAEFVQSVKDMLRDGAPIGGVNDQAHFSKTVPENGKLWACLDALGSLGLPVKVTEFDINTTDEQQQAKDTRRFYRVCFAHPAVDAIVMWGFWEGRHWRPNAALWRKDWTIKPNAEAYVKLIDEEWITKGEAEAVNGEVGFRGFYGEYEMELGGKRAKVLLTKEKTKAEIRF
jgi:endo-1,4-beta-xylanase